MKHPKPGFKGTTRKHCYDMIAAGRGFRVVVIAKVLKRPGRLIMQLLRDSLAERVSGAQIATGCRGCAAIPLTPILSLGHSPLANALVQPKVREHPEPRYPLEVLRCPHCSLVQLSISVAPELLFRDYVYLSSVSDAFVAHARAIVDRVIARRTWNNASLAMEIASNDGYLLQHYRAHGIPVLGIEPARNIARIAREQRGIDTIEEFFGSDLAARLAAYGRRADVIHANNVLAHVPDVKGVLAGIRLLLKDEGEAIIEVPSLRDMIDRLEFDTIYHEHLFYFCSPRSTKRSRARDLRLRMSSTSRCMADRCAYSPGAVTRKAPAIRKEPSVSSQCLKPSAPGVLTT